MKILFLTVKGTYHAPLLLREVFTRSAVDEFRIVISGRKLTARKTLKAYGVKYTYYKAWERLLYMSRLLRERRRGLALSQRQYLTLDEVLRAFSIRHETMERINRVDNQRVIGEFAPDLMVSLYFDQILSPKVLALSHHTPINLHPSLLPSYAGSSPTFWVMANEETVTGITMHEMAKEADAGKILYQRQVPILSDDTQFSLYRRMTLLYVEPLMQYIETCRQNQSFSPTVVGRNLTPSYSRITNTDIDRFLHQGRRFI